MSKREVSRRQEQSGSVLLWGLAGLLVLTVLGVAATKIAQLDLKMAGNSMFEILVYQGAESALGRSINLSNVTDAAVHVRAYHSSKVLGPYSERAGAGNISSRSEMSMGEQMSCPPVLRGVAISTSMIPKSGGVACRVFTAQANSELPGTAASSNHVEGRFKYVPAE